MPWMETCVEDIRLSFITACNQSQETIADICAAYGISRKTGHKWINRYLNEGEFGLKDKSRRPSARPRDTDPGIEKVIISTRLKHPKWGPKKILRILQNENHKENWPSETTIANILKRNGCSTRPMKRSKLAFAGPLSNSDQPNDVWSADFKGWWRTENGEKCEPFTLLDSYSRYLLACRAVPKVSFKYVQPILIEAFQEFGMPASFRTDNGPPFASNSIGRLSKLSIWLIKLGIKPEWITPGKPQENGRHERMHRTLKQEIKREPMRNLREQEMQLTRFQHEYNFIRPHESLLLETPANVYQPSVRKWTEEVQEVSYPEEVDLRKVDKRGYVNWRGIRFFTTERLYGEYVGIRKSESKYPAEVYFGPILLGYIDLINGFRKV